MAGKPDLTLHEATVSLAEGDPGDGTITLDVIRPCQGRGRGKRVYTAKMLEQNADVFTGWKMYLDHKDEKNRSVRDLGGRIIESWWDPNVPADAAKGYGQGAVRAKAKPTPFVRELVENDPELLEASINGAATSIRFAAYKGRRAPIVEGIQRRGSLDWVTEAGAGGRVADIREAVFAEEDAEQRALAAQLTDEELLEAMEDDGRESLAGALRLHLGLTEDTTDGTGDEPDGAPDAALKEDEDMPLTAEALREALQDDGFKRTLVEALDVEGLIEAQVQEQVEQRLEETARLMRAEARQSAFREVELRDMRQAAHEQIAEAKLPAGLATRLKARYSIVEGRPTEALDVYEELEADGATIKRDVMDVLAESVAEAVEDARALLREVDPTVVTGQGGSGGDGLHEGAEGAAKKGTPILDSLLESAHLPTDDEGKRKVWAA